MHPEILRRIAADRIDEMLRGTSGQRPRRCAATRTVRAGLPVLVGAIGLALRRCAVAVAGGVVRAWRMNADVQRRLYAAQHPWEHEGPLRWQGRRSRPRLVGRHLPTRWEEDAFRGRAHDAT